MNSHNHVRPPLICLCPLIFMMVCIDAKAHNAATSNAAQIDPAVAALNVIEFRLRFRFEKPRPMTHGAPAAP